jgi:hypothetical protein
LPSQLALPASVSSPFSFPFSFSFPVSFDKVLAWRGFKFELYGNGGRDYLKVLFSNGSFLTALF